MKNPRIQKPSAWRRIAAPIAWLIVGAGLAPATHAADTSPAQQLERFSVQAGAPGQPERGRVLFTTRQGGDTAKVDKWLRCNCNDVLKRECSAGEKADLLAYLQTLAR